MPKHNVVKFYELRSVLNSESTECFTDDHKGPNAALPAVCPSHYCTEDCPFMIQYTLFTVPTRKREPTRYIPTVETQRFSLMLCCILHGLETLICTYNQK